VGKLTTEDFIEKARAKHGELFSYDSVEYISAKTKVRITCDIHGTFDQTPDNHLQGQGCPLCGKDKRSTSQRSTTEDFIEKAKAKHGDIYDYSLVEYINVKSKVKIICNIHGTFEQTPDKHLQGASCQICARENSNESRRGTLEDFIEKAKTKHGDIYDYSLVEYTNVNSKVKILCSKHGPFEQVPKSHLNGSACPLCGNVKRSASSRSTTEEFIEKSKAKHGDVYDYSLVKYKLGHSKIKIICSAHGMFKQTPTGHLTGRGCALCGNDDRVGHSDMKWSAKCKAKNKVAKLYWFLMSDGENKFVKIGKTYQDIDGRISSIKSQGGFDVEVLKVIEGDPLYISKLERRVHKFYKKFQYIPTVCFAGQTECFEIIKTM
jgi:hypothetical protein